MLTTSKNLEISDEVRQILGSHIETIANDLLSKKDSHPESGLLTGKAGVALLFAYLSKAYPEKNYLDTTFSYLEDLGNALANEELDYHLTVGVAGIAYAFQHLRNIGILDISEDLNLDDLDIYLSQGADKDFQETNWDPLHGMVGIGVYFLERHKETGDGQYLEKIVDYLDRMRIPSGDYKLWMTPGYEKFSKDNFNFGTAHGMCGILSFLSQVHSAGIRQKLIEEMIGMVIPYLLESELSANSVCKFPFYNEVEQTEKQTESSARLAWCYGDLCVAYALIHCGKALNNNTWYEKGVSIAELTTKRTFDNGGCIDSPICHGSVGLVHQFNRLFQLTGNPEFKKAGDYWITITLEKFYLPGEFSTGYFSATFNEANDKFVNHSQNGLLEGSAGIALIYLSLITEIKPEWSSIFLIYV